MSEVYPWAIIEKLREQHKIEIHDVWMPLVAQHRENCEQLQSRIEVLEKENASLKKDVKRHQLRLETIRALYPSAPSDTELDTVIDAAMQTNKETNA